MKRTLSILMILLLVSTLGASDANAKSRKKTHKAQTSRIHLSANISGAMGLNEYFGLYLYGTKGNIQDNYGNIVYKVKVDSFQGNRLILSLYKNGVKIAKMDGTVESESMTYVDSKIKSTYISWYDGQIFFYKNNEFDYSTVFTLDTPGD